MTEKESLVELKNYGEVIIKEMGKLVQEKDGAIATLQQDLAAKSKSYENLKVDVDTLLKNFAGTLKKY